jgi:hypothetical protein
MEGVLVVFHIDLFQDFHALRPQGTSYCTCTCTRETTLIKEYRFTEGKGEARKQNSPESSSQGLLVLLRELMESRGISAMVAPWNSITTVNTTIAHRMRAAGTSVGYGIIGETAQLAVFADF